MILNIFTAKKEQKEEIYHELTNVFITHNLTTFDHDYDGLEMISFVWLSEDRTALQNLCDKYADGELKTF